MVSFLSSGHPALNKSFHIDSGILSQPRPGDPEINCNYNWNCKFQSALKAVPRGQMQIWQPLYSVTNRQSAPLQWSFSQSFRVSTCIRSSVVVMFTSLPVRIKFSHSIKGQYKYYLMTSWPWWSHKSTVLNRAKYYIESSKTFVNTPLCWVYWFNVLMKNEAEESHGTEWTLELTLFLFQNGFIYFWFLNPFYSYENSGTNSSPNKWGKK